MSKHSDDVRLELLRPLVDQLPNIAWDRIPESDRSVHSVAETMVSSLATAFIDYPTVDACHTARGLAAPRGATREAVNQQRRACSLLSFRHVFSFRWNGKRGNLAPFNTQTLEQEWLKD